ncbi:apolipoprotein acyltransferase [Sedimentitalea sp. HM32M-2]|uniref:apolipoprotein acyltransferase n=1 Tax=Sedimentitalea sp. HM32M-2 TaxID=3351566 RepID=UPI003626C2FA
MIVIAGVIFGAILGGLTARRRGGKPADIAQYAVASGMACGIVAMIVTVLLHRLAV